MQTKYLIKNSYLELIKNFQNSIGREEEREGEIPISKWARDIKTHVTKKNYTASNKQNTVSVTNH
jgi:hypothetical protein